MEKLKTNRRSAPDQTEIERWKEVYRILFRHEAITSSLVRTPLSDFHLGETNIPPVYESEQ
jgi:hypothetical protein